MIVSSETIGSSLLGYYGIMSFFDNFVVINKVMANVTRSTGKFSTLLACDPLHMSLLKPRQVIVISRLLGPMRISTAVGEESAHLSSTTRLIQSRYWNKELVLNYLVNVFAV